LGVAYSQRGKGTFVSRIKLEKKLSPGSLLQRRDAFARRQPQSKVLNFRLIKPDDEIAEALHLTPEDEVTQLRRVRLADSVPLCIECTHIPVRNALSC